MGEVLVCPLPKFQMRWVILPVLMSLKVIVSSGQTIELLAAILAVTLSNNNGMVCTVVSAHTGLAVINFTFLSPLFVYGKI